MIQIKAFLFLVIHIDEFSIEYCYLFYNDYETSISISDTTYINDARWYRCLRSDGLRVRGNRSARIEYLILHHAFYIPNLLIAEEYKFMYISPTN